MEQEKQQFPTEEVTLPSKGLLYDEGNPLKSGKVKMKYMTAREEDILTNQNLINKGTVIDELLKALIVDTIDFNTLLVGDKNALLVASRILGYGSDYTVSLDNPSTNEEEIITIDLTKAEDKELDESLVVDGKNEFEFILPSTKIPITFKFLSHGDDAKIQKELKGLKKINKNASPELSTRMKHLILSVNGDYEQKTIREFVDMRLLARDARALRERVREIMPDIDLNFDIEFSNGHIQEDVIVPIGVGFFWPDASV